MSLTEQTEQIAGNIHTAIFTKEDNGFQSIKYFFTYHIQSSESFELAFQNLEPLKDICDKYIWGEEYGKSGNTPHIQGAFILKSKMRAKTLEKFFTNGVTLRKLKNWDCAFKYCQKEGHQIQSSEKLIKPLKIITNLKPYQSKVVELLSKDPDDRTINWVVGGYGLGKTQLCKYLVFNKIAFGPLEGDKRHILSVIAENQNENCYIIYLTADESKFQKHSLFDCIEKIKDGFFMSHFGTEGTKPVIMNSPHILVVANRPPSFNKTKMDRDRFNILNICPDTFDIIKGDPTKDIFFEDNNCELDI